MNTLLTTLVSKLPKRFRRYAKALVPLVAASAAAGTDLALSGDEARQLAELAGGAVTALIVLAVPNLD